MRKAIFGILLLSLFISFISLSSASYVIDKPFIKGEVSQMLLPCTYNSSDCSPTFTCNISLNSPIILNQNMGTDYYPYWNVTIKPNTIGSFEGKYTCCDSVVGCGTDDIKYMVTPNGDDPNNNGFLGLIIVLIALSALFAGVGFSFDKQHWIIKSALFMGSLLVMTIAVSIGVNFAIGERMSTMMNTVLIIATATIAAFFMFIIINYLRSVANAVREAKNERISNDLM